jgi:hypothetical protein
MFFSIHSFVLIVLGIIILLFAGRISDAIRGLSKNSGLSADKYRSLLYVWPIRGMGIMLIGFGILEATSGPPRGIMQKDVNRIALLENGKIIKGEATKIYYGRLAPEGWKVLYKFIAEEPNTNQQKTYWGSALGPRKYYINLSTGDPLTIIYNPLNPKVNCEIRCFLNNPSYRSTFEKAKKSYMLDKFKNEYELEDYTFKEWFNLARQK